MTSITSSRDLTHPRSSLLNSFNVNHSSNTEGESSMANSSEVDAGKQGDDSGGAKRMAEEENQNRNKS